VILLQVGCVELDTRDVTFGKNFEGLNDDQYFNCFRPIKGCRGHQHWLEGPINSLSKANHTDYNIIILDASSSSCSWNKFSFGYF
jgi:hypothetical protein